MIRNLPRWAIPLVLGVAFSACGAAATYLSWSQGWNLYSGDGLAHLNIARRMEDSRTPGFEQVGSVWLPVPHLAMLPFVRNDDLWRSALAGAIPAGICYVAACLFLYFSLSRLTGSILGAVAGTIVFGLNPNLLYLQSSPMTEPFFLAGFLGMLYALIRYSRSGHWMWAIAAGLAGIWTTLCRYEGWALAIGAATWILLARPRQWWVALIAAFLLAAGPAAWLAHNQYYAGDALEFYHGPHSARAIYQRALDAGMRPQPADGNPLRAIQYYLAASAHCVGWFGLGAATLAVGAAFRRKQYAPVAFLLLPAVTVVASVSGGGTPIFVPELPPYAYYNVRYGLTLLPLAALGTAFAVALFPSRRQGWIALAAAVLLLVPWWLRPSIQNVTTWREAEANSRGRRIWAEQTANFLRQNYKNGQGILASFGMLTPVFQRAGIPLRETLHSGNYPAWPAAFASPERFLREEWAVALSDDEVFRLMDRLETLRFRDPQSSPRYELVEEILTPAAPAVRIYRRR